MTIQYNKLHADPKQGKTLDIAMKKVKHRLVENMSSSTADALGLSRAILCNDSLVCTELFLTDALDCTVMLLVCCTGSHLTGQNYNFFVHFQVKKLDDLQRTQDMYQALMDHTKRLLKAFFDLAIVYKS